MAKSIQDLRREKGFRSSREFAEALGVSPSSMSRYDKDPQLIPVKVAWAMADLLGCSIDEVLGRKHVTSGRSELQEDYDSLSPQSQALVCEFMEFVKAKDKKTRDRARVLQDQKFDRLCQFYESMFYQSLYQNAEFDDPVIFVSFFHEREAFEQFITRKAAEKRMEHAARNQEEYVEEVWKTLEQKDKEVIDAILVAYDRRHGNSSHVYDLPRMTVEYMGGLS